MTALPVLSDTIESYLVEIDRFPLLSKDEEYRLAVRYHEQGDLDAAHSLVTSNLRFVVKIALEYRSYGAGLKDLIQEGNIGLMTAVKKFNPFKGFRLITYAVWWIRSFIQEYILKTRTLVKRSSKSLKRKLFYRCAAEPSTDPEALASLAAAGAPGLPYDEASLGASELSLDVPIGDNGERTHLEALAAPGPSHDELIAAGEERAIVKRDVGSALARLSDRERFVIEKRVLADEPLSLQHVGDELGLTRERVRQIQGSALKKLKKDLSGSLSLLPLSAP